MQDFWNQRYSDNETVYGINPNKYFQTFIDSHEKGSLLLAAEGEGRNAMYAASKGWQVDAFDFSEVAIKKALQLAEKNNLHFNYELKDITTYKAGKEYDAVGLIYVHLPLTIRIAFHKEIIRSIKKGGYLIIEAFSKEQINFTSGGPTNIDLLYNKDLLLEDFKELSVLCCTKEEIFLNEGDFHKGKASVVRLLAQKV